MRGSPWRLSSPIVADVAVVYDETASASHRCGYFEKNYHSHPSFYGKRRLTPRHESYCLYKLDLYSCELSNIEEVFQRSKLSPPMSKTLPQSASCIAWSLRLYQRAKRPIVRFSCHEVMLACPLGNNVKQKYLGFARSIDAFKDTIYKKWDKGVTSTVTEALKKTIIIESNGVWPSHDLTATGRFLTSNFSPQINQVIREAKYLSDLGLKIPDEALSVVFQEDTFNG